MNVSATLDKSYPGCVVLREAVIAICAGSVHALVGENGAGKSTLVKILAGVLRGDRGTLEIDGKSRELATWTRQAARNAGIGIVQQHGAFAGTLSVVENAVLGVEPFVLDLDDTARALKQLGDQIGLPIDPWARADSLSLGAAQRAEIVAALHYGAKLLVLDEPTAVLAPIEVAGLLDRLRTLASQGTTILIVTHKLDEVRTVADDVTVLRAGKTVATFDLGEGRGQPHRERTDVDTIARAMVGSDLPVAGDVPAPRDDAPIALALEDVDVRERGETTATESRARGGAGDGSRTRASEGIDLRVRSGEIVGIAGVDGNGQRELALAVAGLASHRGRVRIGDREPVGARARLAAGLAHIPEDRHHGGLVLDATVADNLVLGRRDITGQFLVDNVRVGKFAAEQIRALDIRPPNPDALVRSLSGGNQQKVVIARELSRPALKAVLAVQPTRGVDLGAVARIHEQLREASRRGAGVLVISADLDELLKLCHRIVVMLRGRIVGERAGEALRTGDVRAELGALMTGASSGASSPEAA